MTGRLRSKEMLLVALLASPHAVFAQTAKLTDDAYTSTNPALQLANLGGNGPVIVVAGTSAGPATAYMKFELTSSLPDNVTEGQVAKATLKLYVSSLSAASELTVSRVTGPWRERGLTSATALTVTPEVHGVSVTRAQAFVTIDVTPLVRDWVSGRQPNDGLALVAARDNSFVAFDTKESPLTSHEPTLEIALAGGSVGPTGPPGPQGPAGPVGLTGPEGPQGPAGPQGSTGPQGLQGTTGVQGAQGPAGLDGAQGPQGPIGPIGPMGPMGPLGFTGATGPPGPAGASGPKGLNWQGAWSGNVDYVVDDAVSFQGSSWRALRPNNDVLPAEGPDWTIVAQKGDPGQGVGVTAVSATSPIVVTDPTTTPSISLGVVPATNGGTGLSSPGALGAFLRSGGSSWTSAPLAAPDVPSGSAHYIQNSASVLPGQFNITGPGAATVFNAGTQFNIGGSRVLSNAGTDNLFAGVNAGTSNNPGVGGGFRNAFFGANAGRSNTAGSANTFVGSNAGRLTTTGGSNAFVGADAGASNVGSLNTFVGSGAGAFNTVGFSNTFLGVNAGLNITTGNSNIFIGANSGNPNTATQVSNSVAIGQNAAVSTNNTIVLGTSAHTTRVPGQLSVSGGGMLTFSAPISHLIADNLVIRRLTSGDVLPSPAPVCFRLFSNGVDGGGAFTTCTTSSSSIRFKKELEPFARGLDLVRVLKPTAFTWKASNERDIGLIAEEVADVEPLFTYKNGAGEIEGVKYSNLSVVFINAIMEQQAQLEQQQDDLHEQRVRLQRQQQQIDALIELVAKLDREHVPRK